jgi:hypothetical protein
MEQVLLFSLYLNTLQAFSRPEPGDHLISGAIRRLTFIFHFHFRQDSRLDLLITIFRI